MLPRSTTRRGARAKARAPISSLVLGLVLLHFAFGCSKSSELSRQEARSHARDLATAAKQDVEEIRGSLAQGALALAPLLSNEKSRGDAAAAKSALNAARAKVQDLRNAKSTFFLVADLEGRILRSDQDQDELAGKSLFSAFAELRAAVTEHRYVEARGSMPEAAGVRGRGDGQWLAAVPVEQAAQVLGVYATGWSWSSYAFLLENRLRSRVKSALTQGQKEPLVYVYVVVGKDAFGAPISPDVIARAIVKLDLLSAAEGESAVDAASEIDGRDFGVALVRAPSLGRDVAIAVARSET